MSLGLRLDRIDAARPLDRTRASNRKVLGNWCVLPRGHAYAANLGRDLVRGGVARPNNGTVVGGVKVARGRSVSAGALEFDGSTGHLEVPLVGTFSGQATWAFWVFLRSVGSDGGAFLKVGNSSSGFGLGIGGSTFDDTGSQLIALREAVAWHPTGINLTAGWTHLAAHFDSGFWAIFVNGVRSFEPGVMVGDPSTTTYLGGYTGSAAENRHVACRLQDVRYWDYTLDDAAIMRQCRQTWPEKLNRRRATYFVPAGGTTVNPSPVTMAAAAPAPARLLALGQTPVALAGGAVAPARALALAAAPVSAAASVPDTDEVLTPATGQGTAAGTAVTPTLALSAAQTPATAALSVPASVAGLAPSVGQGQAVGAVAAPTLTLAAAVGSVVITGAVVTPSTDGSTTVLPAAITVAAAVAAPALSLGLVQAPVTVALTVVAPTAALSSAPAAVTVAAGVAAPTLALSSPQGTVGAAGSVVAPMLALGLGVDPASATGGVVAPTVQAGNVQSPGAVAVTAAVAAPALALTQSVAALTALFTIPVVDIQGLTVHDLLLGTAEVLPGLGGTLRALPQLNGVAELLPNLGGRVVLNPLV